MTLSLLRIFYTETSRKTADFLYFGEDLYDYTQVNAHHMFVCVFGWLFLLALVVLAEY